MIIVLLLVGLLQGLMLKHCGNFSLMKKIEKFLLPSLFMFLFTIGLSTGAHAEVIANLGRLSFHSFILSIGGIMGSVLFVPLMKRLVICGSPECLNRCEEECLAKEIKTAEKSNQGMMSGLKTSSLILICFVVGLLIGWLKLLAIPTDLLEPLILVALYGLVWVVGISVGSDASLGKMIRSARPSMLLIPALVVLGTLLGCAVVSNLIPSMSLRDSVGVGVGMGYYSLSSAMISSMANPTLGLIALLVSLIREVATIGLAPLIVRAFGPYGLIASGATTTFSSSLPSI